MSVTRPALLLLLLSPAGRAAVLELPSGDLSAPLSPALVQGLADPANPLLPRLEAAAGRYMGLGPLLEPKSSAADRLAAGALARLVAEPGAAARLEAANPGFMLASLPALAAAAAGAPAPARKAELALLAEAARRDPAASSLFDGLAEDPFAGLVLDGKFLRQGGAAGRYIGKGGSNLVYAHPTVAGAVVKLTRVRALEGERPVRSPFVDYAHDPDYNDPERIALREAEVSRLVAAAGAGPRPLGLGFVGGRWARLMERVYGPTMQKLIAEDLLDGEDVVLGAELAGRLAAARLNPGDLGYDNVMLGRTLVDPARRAYLVDGGWLESWDGGEELRKLRKRFEFGRKRP